MSESVWRFEKKIVFSKLSEERILNNIVLSPAHFQISFPNRQVNNLYLDTQEMDCFHNHNNGTGRRFKARLRWYGNFADYQRAHLEIKFKDSDTGSKFSYKTETDLIKLDRFHVHEAIEKMKMPASFKEQLLGMQPVLFNRYQRAYHQSLTGKIRVTVDKEISYRSVDSRIWMPEKDGLKILELKYGIGDGPRGKKILQHFPDIAERSSKYIRGIIRTRDV